MTSSAGRLISRAARPSRLPSALLGRSLYLGLGRVLAGDREAGWRMNRTLANSKWTAGRLCERLGLGSEVVYPPVGGDFPGVGWGEREDGFVAVGRLVPEKRFDLIIAILAEVRKSRPVHLHIIGRPDRTARARKIETLCRRHGDWIRLEGEMYGPEKEAFLAKHKYGLSGCRTEAFGIAVAEMVKAGLAPRLARGARRRSGRGCGSALDSARDRGARAGSAMSQPAHPPRTTLRRKRRARWLQAPRTLRPTRAGWVFFAFTLGVGLAALNTGNNLLYMIHALLLSFLVLSGVLSESALRGIRVRRLLPAELVAERVSPIALEIANDQPRIPAFAIVVEDFVASGQNEHSATGRAFALRIGPRERDTRSYAFAAKQRGKLEFSGVRVGRRFRRLLRMAHVRVMYVTAVFDDLVTGFLGGLFFIRRWVP